MQIACLKGTAEVCWLDPNPEANSFYGRFANFCTTSFAQEQALSLRLYSHICLT